MSHSALPLLIQQMIEAVGEPKKESVYKDYSVCGYMSFKECFKDKPIMSKLLREYEHNNGVWECYLNKKLMDDSEYLERGDIHPVLLEDIGHLNAAEHKALCINDRKRKLTNYKKTGKLEPAGNYYSMNPK